MALHRKNDLPVRVAALLPYCQESMHSLRSTPGVVDICNAGLELVPRPGKPTARAMAILQRCFDDGLLIRTIADILALSSPLIAEKHHVDRIVQTLDSAIRAEAARRVRRRITRECDRRVKPFSALSP